MKRIVSTHGRVRPDMGEGCPEKFDLGFLHWVATFRRRQRPKVITALAESGVRTIWLRTGSEQAAFAEHLQVEGLERAAAAAQLLSQRSGFSSTTM